MDIIYKDEAYKIIGAAMEVHRELGCGFLEAVYQEALEYELRLKNIPFEREKPICIAYKGTVLTKTYIADFLCYNKIILETKATDKIMGQHEAQVINYLKACKMPLGLLVNFGSTKFDYKRIIRLEYYNENKSPKQTE